jgi:ribosomal protein S18 acetylase RimI-like enzyme
LAIRIRPAIPDDADGAVALVAQLAEYASGAPAAGAPGRFRAMLGAPNQAIFVAEDTDGRLCGLLTVGHQPGLWHSGPSALIQELVVHVATRRQGVGRALIEAAVHWARAAGCSEIGVSTELDNVAAQAFYHRTGFDGAALLLERHFSD